MRSTLRFAVLLAVLLALLGPIAAYADGPASGDNGAWGAYTDGSCPGSNPCVGTSTTGPCPDDPAGSAECDQATPPYYVVINRNITCQNRTGTGCAPFILSHPDCTDCRSPACASINVEAEVCQAKLAGQVPEGQTAIVYEMCCAGAAGNSWLYRMRVLDTAGNCPIDPQFEDWREGLPPGTGVKLPAPLIAGGLSVIGAGLVAVGLVIRHRKS